MNKSEVFARERVNQMVTPTEDFYPDHDGGKFAPIEATTVATWKARAFLENLTVDAEGAVFVTVYSHNRVDRYDPATGATTTFAEVPAPPMGLAFDAGGVLWMTSGPLYEGPGFIWRVERTGAVRQWCELPDATFMNGCTMHPRGLNRSAVGKTQVSFTSRRPQQLAPSTLTSLLACTNALRRAILRHGYAWRQPRSDSSLRGRPALFPERAPCPSIQSTLKQKLCPSRLRPPSLHPQGRRGLS